jgi:glycosyltransferase involved in cell wall biosynthesis
MRVLNVIGNMDTVLGGGTAERTYQLSRNLVLAGHQVTILTTDIGLHSARLQALSDVRIVGLTCLFRRFLVVVPRWLLVLEMVKNVDVIHIMGHWSMLNILVYWAARFHRKPYFVCPAGELFLFGRSMLLKRLFNMVFGNRLVRDAVGWIAVTDDERSHYANYGINPARVSVLPNGVVPEELTGPAETALLAQLGIQTKRYILFVGRLNPIKGPDLLLEAFVSVSHEHSDIHLVFAGPDGGLLSQLTQRSHDSGLALRLHFPGFISGADKATLYRNAIFLVIPSRHEAMSIVVLEAGAVGVPVLLTDQCGFDVVERIDGGIVVDSSVEGITRGIKQLIQRRDELCEMGSRLRSLVMNSFTWTIIVQRYVDLFASRTRSAS